MIKTEVGRVLEETKVDKAAGMEGVRAEMLKKGDVIEVILFISIL